jgi:hypothetical protein
MKCGQCGKDHDIEDLELGFGAPDAYYQIPEEEREARAELTPETCRIDDDRFYLRGVMEIAVRGRNEGLGLGLWAQTSRQNFERYGVLSHDDEQSEEAPFMGVIANDIAGQPALVGVPVTIQLESATQRPSLWAVDTTHPLAANQRDGIDERQVLDILNPYLH